MCIHMYIYCCCSVAKSCPHCLQPHELQHARLPCPSPSSGVCLNTYLLNQWWLPIISSSVTSFPSCLQNLSNHQSLFQWVGSSYQVAKVLKLQLHRQSFQWMFRVDFLQDWPTGVKYLLSGPSWPFMDKSSETGFRQWNIDKLLHDSSENLIRLVYHCPATFEGQAFHILWIRACLNA